MHGHVTTTIDKQHNPLVTNVIPIFRLVLLALDLVKKIVLKMHNGPTLQQFTNHTTQARLLVTNPIACVWFVNWIVLQQLAYSLMWVIRSLGTTRV
jgi:hypothetical protein